jgi:hypothetical protein
MVEWELAEETGVIRENHSQRHFVHNKSHIGSNPGSCTALPATNRLSYNAAYNLGGEFHN